MRYDRTGGQSVELTGGFDNQVDEMIVTPDSKTIYFVAGVNGKSRVFTVPVEPDMRQRTGTQVRSVESSLAAFPFVCKQPEHHAGRSHSGIRVELRWQRQTEIFAAATQGVSIKALSRSRPNYTLPAPEELEWKGTLRTPVHGFLLKPANFDANRKYPLLVLIHGRAQGAWSDDWGYR